MASSPSITEKITLVSHDDHEFEVAASVAFQSRMIRNFVDHEDSSINIRIPLQNVSGAVLEKAVEYCKKHDAADNGGVQEDDIRDWDAEFVNQFDQETLLSVVMAANYLHIDGLLDLTCQAVADRIKGKTVEQIRETFDIKNDFDAKEEERIRRENEWAFVRTGMQYVHSIR